MKLNKVKFIFVFVLIFSFYLASFGSVSAAAKTSVESPTSKISSKGSLTKSSEPKTKIVDKLSLIKNVFSKIKKKSGNLVNQGDIIGYEGGMPGTCGAGLSTGPHLHFEVRRNGSHTNPRDLLGNAFIWPMSGYRVTQEYGPADWTPWYTFHTGIDLAVSHGTPVRAVASGTIILNQISGGYGHLIIIDHGGGLRTYYGHLICS